MKLIKIARNIFIDPSKISAVRFAIGDTNTNATVVVEGIVYPSDMAHQDIVNMLIHSGIEYNEQFFGG